MNLILEVRSEKGEVKTPESLVQEMLSRIPEKVFKSSSTTFLDPCFGSGTFLIEIIKKLREYGHSMENISKRVVGVEVKTHAYNYVRRRLNKYNFNLIKADSLTYNFKNMKFDVVIGNPPFDTLSSGTSQKLWVKFVDKGIENLKPNGYLLYVTPTSWLNTSVNTYKSFQENTLLYSKILTYPVFGNSIGTSVSYYLMQKFKPKSTEFPLYVSSSPTSTKGPFTLDFSNKNLTPVKNPNPYVYSIMDKVFFNNDPKLKVIRDSRLHTQTKKSYFSSTQNPNRSFELFQSNKVKYFFDANEVSFTKEQIKEHNQLKILIPLTSSLRIKNIKPNISCTQNTGWVSLNNNKEGENIFSFLNSKLFKYIDSEVRVTIGLPSNIIKNLPDVRNISFSNDKELYDYFNLTQEEIDTIEND